MLIEENFNPMEPPMKKTQLKRIKSVTWNKILIDIKIMTPPPQEEDCFKNIFIIEEDEENGIGDEFSICI